MKKPKDPVWTLIVWYLSIIAIILTVIAVAASLSSCEVLKTKQSRNTDSITASKVDSTRVTKIDNGSRNDSSWWREIINFLPKGGDTTINNITTPVHNYYPAQIIREGGTVSKEDWLKMLDSVNKAKSDTASVSTQEESKGKETKVGTQWYIWVILGLVGLIAFKLFFKLK